MKNLTKVLSMLLVIVMCMGLFGGSAFAVENEDLLLGNSPTSVLNNAGNNNNSNSNVSVAQGSQDIELTGQQATNQQSANQQSANQQTTPQAAQNVNENSLVLGGSLMGSNQLASIQNPVSTEPVASVNGTPYNTLENAIAAANSSGSVVTLLASPTSASTDKLTLSAGTVIDLAGYTLSIATPVRVSGNGTATIRNGVLDSSAGTFAALDSNSSLYLENLRSGSKIAATSPCDSGSIVIDGSSTNLNVTNAGFFNKSYVTVNAGTFSGSNPTSCVSTTVSGSGPWVVGNNLNTKATIGSNNYSSLNEAIRAARTGDTINLSDNASLDMASGDLSGKNITINSDKYTLTLTGNLPGGTTLKITGTKAALSGNTVNGTLEFSGSSDTVVSGAIVVAVGGELNVSSGAKLTGAITNSGTVSLTGNGRIELTSLTMQGSTLVMSDPNAIIRQLTLTNPNHGLYVSAGTVLDTIVNTIGTSHTITGGTWGGIDTTELTGFKGFVSTIKEPILSATNTYDVRDPAGVVNKGTVSQANSGVYVYFLSSEYSNSGLVYNVKVPSGDSYPDYHIDCIDSSGVNLGGLSAGTDYDLSPVGSDGGSTCTLKNRGLNLDRLKADKLTLRFIFNNNSYVDQTIYTIPKATCGDRTYVKNGSDSLSYSLSNPAPGGYLVSLPNSSDVSSATLLSSSYYSHSGNTLTLRNSYLDGLTSGATYNIWFRYSDGKVYAMPSFGIDAAPATNPNTNPDPYNPSNPSNPYNPYDPNGYSQGGTILVEPLSTSRWYQGDGLMKFRVSEDVDTIKVDGYSLYVEDYWNRGDKRIELGEKYMSGLTRGWHTLDVYHTVNGVLRTGYCTFYVGPTLVPKDTDKHVTGSSLDLKYVCTDRIIKVFVGSQDITSSDFYSLSLNNKTLTLKSSFLNNRNPGSTYNLTVYVDVDNDGYYDDEASSTFRILTKAEAAASPRTGDDSSLALWTLVLALSGAAAIVVVPRLKKRED